MNTFNLTSVCSDIRQPLYPPLHLESDHEIALGRLETYNSIPNVDDTNNIIHYQVGDNEYNELEIPTGAYELSQINDIIQKETQTFELVANTNTLKCIVRINNPDVKVHFNHDRSMRHMLGFEAVTVQGEGDHEGSSIVNILRVNTIYVNCNIITGSYVNGSQQPVLYSFFPNVPPGYKVVEVPTTPIYLPISARDIESIRLWLTDQDGNALDMRGERISVTLLMRSTNKL